MCMGHWRCRYASSGRLSERARRGTLGATLPDELLVGVPAARKRPAKPLA